MKNSDQLRHILKTISWRIVGTIDTMIVSYIVTGSIKIGLAIGGFEVFTKMVLYYLHERVWFNYISIGRLKNRKWKTNDSIGNQKLHVEKQAYQLSLEQRIRKNKHEPKVFWMTGLSGSGKSTIANAFQNELFLKGYQVMVLDGDNMRKGLNQDLDFSDLSRNENIRRVSEVAKLFLDSGFVVITAFISPFESDRKLALEIIGEQNFCEVFIDTPLEVCEKRDVKGLYQKARNGEITQFTGIDSPFEIPRMPKVHIKTSELTVDESVRILLREVPKFSF
jgi:adenylylsulfate kinase